MEFDFKHQLDIYLRARFTLIVVVSPEEERAIQMVRTLCEQNNRPCVTWDSADGFSAGSDKANQIAQANDPILALERVEKEEGAVVFVFKDFHDFWDTPQAKRKLRNVAQKLKYTKKSLIVTTPASKVPDELMDEAVIVRLPPPTAKEVEQVLDSLTQTPGVKVNLTPLGREKMVQAAMGMTASQAQRVFAKAIVTDGTLDDRDILLVTEEKKQIVRQSEALEFYSVTETPDNVGGLGVLKEWLRLREKAFTREARDYGLPAPKGIVLLGIPGTGKSLTAKMIGNMWRLPLLRLDVGALFGSLVGESEERTRKALSLAETVAPCILWVDEIEKAFAFGYGDAGTSQRVFASLLTWMQDKTAPCFVAATANNIAALPPELLRRGRFDEVFFLDLPTYDERKEIFAVHLKKRNRMPQHFELDRLASESDGYVGAELEQAIIDAMYLAFNEGEREITTDDISACLKRQAPLSISQKETVQALRNWLLEGRAQSASFAEVKEAEERFAAIPLELKHCDNMKQEI